MSVTGAPARASSAILRTSDEETAMRWSIRGVRRRIRSRSSSERIRDEWTVPTTYGRGRAPAAAPPPPRAAARDAGPLQASHGAARGQRADGDVVALPVDAGHEVEDVLLGAAVRAGRQELHDPDPVAAARQRQPGPRPGARIVAAGGGPRARRSSP